MRQCGNCCAVAQRQPIQRVAWLDAIHHPIERRAARRSRGCWSRGASGDGRQIQNLPWRHIRVDQAIPLDHQKNTGSVGLSDKSERVTLAHDIGCPPDRYRAGDGRLGRGRRTGRHRWARRVGRRTGGRRGHWGWRRDGRQSCDDGRCGQRNQRGRWPSGFLRGEQSAGEHSGYHDNAGRNSS